MFKELSGAFEAQGLILDRIAPKMQTESCPIEEASGRVLAADLASPENLPSFDRAAMDGYAVDSSTVRGASPLTPVMLKLGLQAFPVRTGAEVTGYDAVVMLEDTAKRGDHLEVRAAVHKGKNLSKEGEDVRIGEVVMAAVRRLRPPDIALLAAVGISEVSVFKRPVVAVIPTGSELVTCREQPMPGQAREINSLMAQAYLRSWGAVPELFCIVPDSPELIKDAIASAIGKGADLVLLFGGTSVGERDYAPSVLKSMGELLVHGIRITPGKPTAFGFVHGVMVVCLPGYPVAAISALYLLVRPAVKRLAHLDERPRTISATLSRKIASRAGYVSMARVTVSGGYAEPIMTTGAGILSSVTRADGFVLIDEESEGLMAGETVEVMLFDEG
jgi:molybdopterin molybdotransferase